MIKILSILIIGFLFFSGFGVIAFSEYVEENNNSSYSKKTNYNSINISWNKHVIDDSFDYAFGVYAFDLDKDGDCDVLGAAQDGGFIVSGRNGRYFNDDSDGILVKFAPFSNERPNKPDAPDGPSNGEPNTEYTFTTTVATDPDGDTVYYKWDWGDGNYSEILDITETVYTWTYEDSFEIRVMAIDEHSGESDWSDPLAFSTPKNKNIDQYPIIIQKILERFPFLKSLMD